MELAKEFTKYIKLDEDFLLAYNIVRKNSKGKVWLIGGTLCRGLFELVHGIKRSGCDFDFIVEKGADKFDLPDGWVVRMNKYGNPKLVGPKFEINYIPINTIASIKRRGLKQSIDNFLSGTPFTIQSMAYDVDNEILIGDIGIKALMDKTFEINNLEQAKIFADKKGLAVEELLCKKARSMRFKVR